MNIYSWEEAQKITSELQDQGKVIVSSNGCFDLLHRGHVEYLEKARQLGDFLIVGINSDESVKKLKGPTRPINNEQDRALVLSALRCVNGVCVFSEPTPVRWLEFIKPQIHAKGGDYRAEEIPEYHTLKAWGGSINILPFVKGYSTSNILSQRE